MSTATATRTKPAPARAASRARAAAAPAPRRRTAALAARDDNDAVTKETAPKKSIFDGFHFLDVGYVTQKKINRRLYGE
jgi:hypothetical protein